MSANPEPAVQPFGHCQASGFAPPLSDTFPKSSSPLDDASATPSSRSVGTQTPNTSALPSLLRHHTTGRFCAAELPGAFVAHPPASPLTPVPRLVMNLAADGTFASMYPVWEGGISRSESRIGGPPARLLNARGMNWVPAAFNKTRWPTISPSSLAATASPARLVFSPVPEKSPNRVLFLQNAGCCSLMVGLD